MHRVKINSLNNEPWSSSGCQTGLRRGPLIPLSPRNILRRAGHGDGYLQLEVCKVQHKFGS